MTKKGKGPHPVHKTYVAIGGSLVALILFAAIFVYLVPTQFVGKAGEIGPQCASVPSGLVAWYKAEGDALDSSGNDNDGHLGTDAVVGTDEPSFDEGKVGDAFHFTSVGGEGLASTDFIEVSFPTSSAFDFGNNPFTIEGWIKTESLTAPQGIISFLSPLAAVGPGGIKGYVIGLNMDPAACWGGKICFYPMSDVGGAGGVWQGVVSDIVDNEWTHIAIVHSGASVIFYVNGENKGNVPVASLATISPGGIDFVIGKKDALAGGLYPFQGMIDELSMYARDLTEEEISSIYHADSLGKCVTETGNSCYDDIDNDNDGDVDCDDADCRAPRSVTLGRSQEYAAILRSDDCPGAGLAVRIGS